MVCATLIFQSPHWWGAAVAAGGLAVLAITWSYSRAPRGPIRWLCSALKALGFVALSLCLLEPIWLSPRARPGANLFAIVVDNSRSLQIKDRGQLHSRGEILQDLVNPQRAGWQAALEQSFDVHRYVFDRRLQSTKDFGELDFKGNGSALFSSLRMLAERLRGRPLAGVLLLTDGNATDSGNAAALGGLGPVYPVVLGNSMPARDLAIQQLHTTQTEFEDAPVSLQADVSATGCPGESIVAEVSDPSGREVASQTLRAASDSVLLAFRFQLRPEKSGTSFYRVRVRSDVHRTPDGKASEATLANNSAVAVVNRGRGPHRILYVAGRPTWEYKFLNRAIQEDDQLQLVGLIRIAKREPKFDFMGRVGENSNPLYRGFDNQSAEEVERYDQPVLVRLNTRDQFELRGGFPSTPEALYSYDALIVDHCEAGFFKAEQAALVQKFVAERGGGLLMLGGMESFREGHYERTPIGDILPVYLDSLAESNALGDLRFELTREGMLQPWARLRETEAAEQTRLQTMSPFQVLNRVRQIKPGASVLATVSDARGQTYPALVVQRFGRGRTGAVTIGDVWRWGFHDPQAHADMDKAWRQLLRWLVSDVPGRVEVTADAHAGEAGDAVKLSVRVRDRKFQPLDNATIALAVQQAVVPEGATLQTNIVHLQLEPSDAEPGLYETTYIPRESGGYLATVCATNANGVEVGRAMTGWSTDVAAEEFRSLRPNVELLNEIARKTGGEIIPANRLQHFVRQLPNRRAPVMESSAGSLWDTPEMLALAMACLVGEWGLRRWKGLA